MNDERIFGMTWPEIQERQQGTYAAPVVRVEHTQETSAIPLTQEEANLLGVVGWFRMVPSGEVVDAIECERRLNSTQEA